MQFKIGDEPSKIPVVKKYSYGEAKYREISFSVENKVYHIQECEGMDPHFTIFDWIEPMEYRAKLLLYFNMEEVIDGPSTMWYCTRK